MAEFPICGLCQCGQVTYKLLASPIAVAACHCTQCQKLSTSAFSITAMIHVSDIEIDGDLKQWKRSTESGQENVAHMCKVCGNHIYHVSSSHPDKIMLKPSSLSDTGIIRPTIHVWVREKQDWYQIPQGAVVFETQP